MLRKEKSTKINF